MVQKSMISNTVVFKNTPCSKNMTYVFLLQELIFRFLWVVFVRGNLVLSSKGL